MDKTTEEELQSLARALDTGSYGINIEELEKLSYGAALKINDHKDIANKYLTDESKAALSKSADSLVVEYSELVGDEQRGQGTYIRKAAACEYFVLQVPKGQEEEGIKAICDSINELSLVGAIVSALTPVSSMDLAQQMFEKPAVAVFCFVHVKPEFREIAKNTRYNTPEGGIGGIGGTLGDLSVDLAPGEFLADGSITHVLSQASGGSKESMIFNRIRDYLKFLPEGTKFLGYRECAIRDLSIPIELKFYNPLFQDIKRVEVDYIRNVARTDGGLKQFNLFVGMRYFGDDPITKKKNVRLYPYDRD